MPRFHIISPDIGEEVIVADEVHFSTNGQAVFFCESYDKGGGANLGPLILAVRCWEIVRRLSDDEEA